MMSFEVFLLSPIPGEIGAAVGGAAVTGIGALWKALSNERADNKANLRELLNGSRDSIEANRLQNDLLARQEERLVRLEGKADEILHHVKAG